METPHFEKFLRKNIWVLSWRFLSELGGFRYLIGNMSAHYLRFISVTRRVPRMYLKEITVLSLLPGPTERMTWKSNALLLSSEPSIGAESSNQDPQEKLDTIHSLLPALFWCFSKNAIKADYLSYYCASHTEHSKWSKKSKTNKKEGGDVRSLLKQNAFLLVAVLTSQHDLKCCTSGSSSSQQNKQLDWVITWGTESLAEWQLSTVVT